MFSFKTILTVFLLLFLLYSKGSGQAVEFHGQAAAWITGNYSGGYGLQGGVRYIPQLLFNFPVGAKFKLEGELSYDSYLNYTHLPDSGNIFGSNESPYRIWIRFSGDRFEIRAGLQKINFGSASMLRPLMWFDRIDPRDPLKLTKGVYGLQGKYFFKNNSSIWIWLLDGNKETKGWETIPSKQWRPEFGGRLQLPVPKGEIALSYHNRVAEFPAGWTPPVTGSKYFQEDRLGFDIKLDLGVGVWFEATVTHNEHTYLPSFTKAMTIGADYTLPVSNGLNIIAEHLVFNNSDRVFSGGSRLNFTGASVSLPLSIITRASTIIFYDWKSAGWYRFANLSFTFDRLVLNLIGFWNPENFSLFNYQNGPNMFAGAGGQVMVVYNY
jgi:hypothetical protein